VNIISWRLKNFAESKIFFDVGLPSVSVFRCSSLSDTVNIIDLNEIQSKCFRMPYWHTEGHTDPIGHVWIVAVILHTND